MTIRNLTATILSVCVFSACTPGMDAAVQSVRSAIQADAGTAAARLDPNFRYLRVTVGGRLAFLALGYVDRDPHGPIEVYYSAQREVVRLQNGRIAGIVGLATEWRNVSIAGAPGWTVAGGAQQPIRWTRTRDVMPGYRFGVRDELVLRVIPSPTNSRLTGVEPQSLSWFQEDALEPGSLPAARYAVDLREGREAVVYSEQCIAPDTCFTWQRWSAEQQNQAVKK